MPGEVIAEVETEIMMGWARVNPSLFVKCIEDFVEKYEQEYTITTEYRKGYMTLRARKKCK